MKKRFGEGFLVSPAIYFRGAPCHPGRPFADPGPNFSLGAAMGPGARKGASGMTGGYCDFGASGEAGAAGTSRAFN